MSIKIKKVDNKTIAVKTNKPIPIKFILVVVEKINKIEIEVPISIFLK